MKLFSHLSIRNIRSILQRFPLSIAFCGVFTFLTAFAVQTEWDDYLDSPAWILLIMAVLLSFALKLFGEQSSSKWIRNLDWLTIPLLVSYFFLLPDKMDDMTQSDLIRMIVLFICIVLAMPFAPFVRDKRRNAFWQFFKTLGLEQLVSIFFSGVLFGGFALSLLSIDRLFDIHLTHKPYLVLFIFISGLFYPIYFFSKVPTDYDKLENDREIGRVIRIFGLYILLPIVSTYAVILYVYMFKILFTFELPEGWVSYLVISFSLVGMFAFMVIHPIFLRNENRLANIYSKCFFWMLIPVLILLYISIFRRLSDYSFTVNRYLILVTALWITGITIYMLYSRLQYIKPILMSLFVVGFLAVIGPWSAFPVCERIQFNRLKDILTEEGLVKNGKVIKNDGIKEISFEKRKDISSIIQYMLDYYSMKSLQPLFSQPLDSAATSDYSAPEYIVHDILGLKYVYKWDTKETERSSSDYFRFYSAGSGLKFNNAYDYLFMLDRISLESDTEPVTVDSLTCKLSKSNQFLIARGNDTIYTRDISIYCSELQRKYGEADPNSRSIDEMTIKEENDKCLVEIIFTNLDGEIYKNDSLVINNMRGFLLMKLKR